MKPIYRVGHTLCNLVGKLAFSFEVIGRDKIIEEGPAILAANHQSYLDPPMVGMACRREIYYLARKSLFRNRYFGWILRNVNSLPVDLSRGDLSAIRTIIKLLKEGHRAAIFPEGTRSLTGRIQSARPGIGMVVAKTLVPVVPIRLFGTYQAWPKGGKIRPHRVILVVGDPLFFRQEDFPSQTREVYQSIADRILSSITALKNPKQ
ncbi:MAG: 1-acyl-sn-glycerol-3-phosphate acyltransferase [Verrucomicrobia bacterium]|nr:1-acyl-sn-glycerol-3-phosphate acyltransferase [Verrucomicrobiota bacterium]